ncbi:MAG: nascent polypeptide-associated complex protein [Candidatus Thermoplasmatota archaeon]
MMPGMPGKMNSRQMKQMMKKLGINIREIENVEKVVIQTDDKEYVFNQAEVTIMDAKGQKTYQISGKPQISEREQKIPTEDIELVAEKTGKNKEEAEKALKEVEGDIAEAIMKLSE